jgi:hypothetical protein
MHGGEKGPPAAKGQRPLDPVSWGVGLMVRLSDAGYESLRRLSSS